MATKTLKYKWEGLAPLMVHNGDLASPFNEHARAIKTISGKRKKTDEDHEKMAKLEFLGSLYMGEKGPVMPGKCIDVVLLKAAKKNKEGPMVKAGAWCEENIPLEFDGPKDPEKMWKDGRFTDQRMVRVQQNKVLRTRPIFEKWALEVPVVIDTDVVPNDDTVDRWMDTAGAIIGLCEWAPRFGRFKATRLKK